MQYVYEKRREIRAAWQTIVRPNKDAPPPEEAKKKKSVSALPILFLLALFAFVASFPFFFFLCIRHHLLLHGEQPMFNPSLYRSRCYKY